MHLRIVQHACVVELFSLDTVHGVEPRVSYSNHVFHKETMCFI